MTESVGAAVVPGDASTLRRGDTIYVISNPLGLAGAGWRLPAAF